MHSPALFLGGHARKEILAARGLEEHKYVSFPGEPRNLPTYIIH